MGWLLLGFRLDFGLISAGFRLWLGLDFGSISAGWPSFTLIGLGFGLAFGLISARFGLIWLGFRLRLDFGLILVWLDLDSARFRLDFDLILVGFAWILVWISARLEF